MDLATYLSRASEDPELAGILKQHPEMVAKATTLKQLRDLLMAFCEGKRISVYESLRPLIVALEEIIKPEQNLRDTITGKIADLQKIPTWPEFLEVFEDWFKLAFNSDNRKDTWVIPVRFLAHPEACERYVFYLQQLLADSLMNCSETHAEPPRPGTFVTKKDDGALDDGYVRWRIAIWLA